MRCHHRNQITAMSVLSPISAICIPFFKASRQLYLHIPFQFMMDIIREPNKHDTYRTVGGSHVKLYEVQEAVSHLQLITDKRNERKQICRRYVLEDHNVFNQQVIHHNVQQELS